MIEKKDEIIITDIQSYDFGDTLSPILESKKNLNYDQLIKLFGGEKLFFRATADSRDHLCVSVFGDSEKMLGHMWMRQSPSLRFWLDKHQNEIFVTGRIMRMNSEVGLMMAELDIDLDMYDSERTKNLNLSWAENLPKVLPNFSLESQIFANSLLLSELKNATEWNTNLERYINNVLNYECVSLSSNGNNVYMDIYSLMHNSPIKEVNEQADKMLKSFVDRDSDPAINHWLDVCLNKYLSNAEESDLLCYYKASNYDMKKVEELLYQVPNNLFVLYKVNKKSFASTLYYSALPKEIYERFLTLIAVHHLMDKDLNVPKTHMKLKENDDKEKAEAVVAEYMDDSYLETPVAIVKKDTVDDNVFIPCELKFFDNATFGSEEGQQKLIRVLKDAVTKIDTESGREWIAIYAGYRYYMDQPAMMKGYTDFFIDIENLLPGCLTKIKKDQVGDKRYKNYTTTLGREVTCWYMYYQKLPPLNELSTYKRRFSGEANRFDKLERVIKGVFKGLRNS